MSTSFATLRAPQQVGGASPATPLFTFDSHEFATCFNQRPFKVAHQLASHPLFELDRLLELARKLPEDLIEYNAGNLPINQDPDKTPRNGLSVTETIERIQTCKSWMVLKQVEHDPAYREVLEACLTEVRPFSEAIAPGMRNAQAFIFITSPGSITPYHIDPEHNFLLQVRGSKVIHLFDGRNRELLSDLNLERFYGGRVRNMTLPDQFKDSSWVNEITPGEGLHFPVTYPHYVQNGPEVSISFSITFRTPDLDRRQAVYAMNSRLRQWGLKPTSPGKHKSVDSLKYFVARVLRKLGQG